MSDIQAELIRAVEHLRGLFSSNLESHVDVSSPNYNYIRELGQSMVDSYALESTRAAQGFSASFETTDFWISQYTASIICEQYMRIHGKAIMSLYIELGKPKLDTADNFIWTHKIINEIQDKLESPYQNGYEQILSMFAIKQSLFVYSPTIILMTAFNKIFKGHLHKEHGIEINDHSLNQISDGLKYESAIVDYINNHATGWTAEITSNSSDQGVDILARHQSQINVAIQCKCYSGAVGNKSVQEVFAGQHFYETEYAMVVTNSHFTEPALKLAEKCGVKLAHHESVLYELSLLVG